jgi:hypothetical protein
MIKYRVVREVPNSVINDIPIEMFLRLDLFQHFKRRVELQDLEPVIREMPLDSMEYLYKTRGILSRDAKALLGKTIKWSKTNHLGMLSI